MNLEQAVNAYYRSSTGLYLPELVASPAYGVYETTTPGLRHDERLDPAAIDSAMDEISAKLRWIEHDGSGFEISTANDDAPSGEYMLHMSTYSSSLSTNHGNGYEFAAQAVRYPDHRHLYIASFANGGTSPFLKQDRAYIAQTGRFTRDTPEGAQPIDSVKNLHLALEAAGIVVTRLMGADSAGGHYSRALAVAMESGQLSHAFFSETSGFIDLSAVGLAKRMLYDENVVNAKQNRAAADVDPEHMDADKVARFTEAFDRHADSPGRQLLAERQVGIAGKIGGMTTSLRALRHGPSKRGDPLVEDANALIARHPNADMRFAMAEHDPLYNDPETARTAALRFLGELTLGNQPASVLIIPGMTHAYNTHFASLYHAVKRHALNL